MAAVSATKSLFTADRFLTSFPASLNPRKPHCILPFAPSVRVFSLKAQFSLVSLKKNRKINVDARISDWAQAEQVEEEEEDFDFSEEGPEARVSDFEGESEGGEVGESEGEGGFEEEESYQEPPEDAKLFVGNLPYDVDSEQLAQIFEKAGIVEVAEVIYNRETDRSRGFGFVTMSTVDEAEKAVEMFHRYDLNGRFLTVNKSSPRGSRAERAPLEFQPSFRVYVGNLPWQVDDARLEQVFSEHGKVVDARVVCDRETGRSRGFGFVTFSSKDEVGDAIAALDGQILDGRALRVNAAEERPRHGSF